MNVNGLVLFKRVTEDICKLIGKNEFFPLAKMYTGEEITTTQLGHVTVTTTSKNVPKPITNKSELFLLLYNFDNIICNCTRRKPQASSSIWPFLQKCAITSRSHLWLNLIIKFAKNTFSTLSGTGIRQTPLSIKSTCILLVKQTT